MEDNKIRIGITQGDINGVGYEVILKTFSDPTMLELCTPIIYGSPKVAAYHRKALDIQTNFSIVNSATEAGYNRLSVVNCTDDEVKVEFSKPDPEAGKAALGALERAIEEYREGLIDVIVTAPNNKHTIQSEEFSFPGHTEYIEERLGNGDKSLMILMKNDFRVALVTTHIPVREIATTITKELIQEKLMIFHRCLKQDFGIGAPRIAVLSLNPHAGDGGLLGMEEQEVIIPAMKEMEEKGILCYGPYAADGFMGSGKTTIGHELARMTGRKFVDTDNMVENEQGTQIKNIFSEYGEDFFRELEYQACKKVASMQNCVVSTGGGAMTYQRNVDAVKNSGKIIFLDVDFNIICERIGDTSTRPLFQDKEKAKSLYDERKSKYLACADIVIDGNKSAKIVASEIAKMFK